MHFFLSFVVWRKHFFLILVSLILLPSLCGSLKRFCNVRGRFSDPVIPKDAEAPVTVEVSTDTSLSGMTVSQLKEKLRSLGLSVTGLKASLIERLKAAEAAPVVSLPLLCPSPSQINSEAEESSPPVPSIPKKLRLITKKLKTAKEMPTGTLEEPPAEMIPEIVTEPFVEAVSPIAVKGGESLVLKKDKSAHRSKRQPRDSDEELLELMEEGEKVISSMVSTFPSGRMSGKATTAAVNAAKYAVATGTDEEIQELITERFLARKRKDFVTADAIREQLRETYGVEISPGEGEWVAADGRRGSMRVNLLPKSVPTAHVPCKYTSEEVQQMVERRTFLRRNHDFEEADRIRDDLAANGIELFDETNEWRSFDGKMEGHQSEDRFTYEVRKDRADVVRRGRSRGRNGGDSRYEN